VHNGQPIHTIINVKDPISKSLINKWQTAIPDLLTRGVQGVADVEPVVANRYKYDYYGLLLFMGIDPKFHYPHMLVNNYSTPTKYLGDVYKVKLLDLAILDKYYKAFNRNL